MKKKGKEITEKEFKKYSEKCLPRQVITQGYLSQKEYEVAHLCNGYNDIDDISLKGSITLDNLKTILNKLRKMGASKDDIYLNVKYDFYYELAVLLLAPLCKNR